MLQTSLGGVPVIALAEAKDFNSSESLFDDVICGRYSLNEVLAAVTKFSKNPKIAHSSFIRSRVRHITREREPFSA